MFGFVVTNPEKLTEEQKTRYNAVYCGLCEALGNERGFRYRMALTYDLVFLAIVLSAVSGEEYSEKTARCPVHPAKKRKFLSNKYSEYAADMNIALAYYKYYDDWQDDKSVGARMKMKIFAKAAEDIEKKYPYQCEVIKSCLKELQETEKAGILIPDVPAEIFGRLLGAVFCEENIAEKSRLYEFGYSLGKFIYVTDAAVDLKSDLKKKRYNPFIAYTFGDTEPILQMLMAECVEKFEALDIKQDKEIIENILFSGVWTAYDARKKGKKK